MGIEPQLLGALSTEAEIWRRGTVTYDDRGNENTAYEFLCKVMGRFEYLTGNEDRNLQELMLYRQRFIVDGGTDAAAADQLRFSDGRYFQIEAVYIRNHWNGDEHHRVVYLSEVT